MRVASKLNASLIFCSAALCALMITCLHDRAERCAQQSMALARRPVGSLKITDHRGERRTPHSASSEANMSLQVWVSARSFSFNEARCSLLSGQLSSLVFSDQSGYEWTAMIP